MKRQSGKKYNFFLYMYLYKKEKTETKLHDGCGNVISGLEIMTIKMSFSLQTV